MQPGKDMLDSAHGVCASFSYSKGGKRKYEKITLYCSLNEDKNKEPFVGLYIT